MRGERQLLRLGEYLVGRACRRLPRDVREERCREWAAELPVILHDPQVRFAPWRAARMLGYAADTLRGAAMAPGKNPGLIPRPLMLLGLVTCLVGTAASILLIVQAPGDGRYYLQLTWCLLFAVYFIGSLAHAPERITMPLFFIVALAFEADTVWATVQAPRDLMYYLDATVLGLALVACLLFALRVRWFRRLLARARRA
jgi:hypothetical protein